MRVRGYPVPGDPGLSYVGRPGGMIAGPTLTSGQIKLILNPPKSTLKTQ